MKTAEIAEAVGGTVDGDESADIKGVAGLTEAQRGDLSFLANPRYAALLPETRATAVIVRDNWKGSAPCVLIRVADPDAAFARAVSVLAPPEPSPAPGVHATAVVEDGASVAPDASVGAQCFIGARTSIGARTVLHPGCVVEHDCTVGEDCCLYPNVSVRERCRIGNRAILHNGTVIGSDGFGFVNEEGTWVKIRQVGIVVVGDDVEIGANATIDRARFGKTTIEEGVKIDNLVQVAHNVSIGKNTAIAAQTGISGSTSVGAGVQLAGQVGVAGHLHIGDGSICLAKSGISKDLPPGTVAFGIPALPHQKARRVHAHMMRLPDLKKRVAELEERIAELEAGAGEGKTDGEP